MAADGAWPEGVAEEPDDLRTRRTVAELRGVLADLEGWLAAAGPPRLGPEASLALAAALESLAARLARHEGAAEARHQALSASVAGLARRLDGAVADLAAVRAAQVTGPRSEPGLIQLILGAASLAAALAVL